MLEAEREALAARITKKDTSRNVAPITWWSVGFLVALAAAVSFLLYEEEEQRKRSRKGVGTPKIGGSWTLVDSDGVPRTDHEFRCAGRSLIHSHIASVASTSWCTLASPIALTSAPWSLRRSAM